MERCPEKISPKRRDETFTVPGRHGNLTTTDGAFESYIRSTEFIVKDKKKIDEICAHFKGSGWLIFSSEPDRKYKARVANQIEKSVLESNPMLITTKKDKTAHGFGVASVKMLAVKYDGMTSFYEKNGQFIADVWLKLSDL